MINYLMQTFRYRGFIMLMNSPFMDFVDSIKTEGVELERRKMGIGTPPKAPLVVEVDNENVKKDIR